MNWCRRHFLLAAVLLSTAVGCAGSQPYRFGAARSVPPENRGEQQVTVSRGRPNVVVDSVGWVFGLPEKVLLWDRRVQNHHVTEGTEDEVCEYLASNGLQDVRVRVNQYDPLGEWKRLVANKDVGAGYRYTFGTLYWLNYTLLPDRLFGENNYNPYTNSLNIYSDVPSMAVREAAYAKDVHNRNYPGTYAAVQEFGPVGMWHQTIATNDALKYYNTVGDAEQSREAYEILSPQYGMSLGGTLINGTVGVLGGAVVGHVAGRVKAATIPDSPKSVSEGSKSKSKIRPVSYTDHDADE